MNESEIAELLMAHDEKGMSEFIKRYGPLIRYIIAPFLADEREREECFSDVTLRVWEKIESFDEQSGSLKTWVSAIARNTALNRARKNKKEIETGELSEDEFSHEETPEESLLRRERMELMFASIRNLSASEQAIFYRKYYYMQSTAQIAAELGTTEKAVENRLYRLKKKLRKMLGGEFRG